MTLSISAQLSALKAVIKTHCLQIKSNQTQNKKYVQIHTRHQMHIFVDEGIGQIFYSIWKMNCVLKKNLPSWTSNILFQLVWNGNRRWKKMNYREEQPKNTIHCLDKKEKDCLIYCSSCVFGFSSKHSFYSCHNIILV